MIAPRRKQSFQVRLLTWYAAHGRDLPWRKTRDPYAVLVSEILSHQTQIARVVPVYEQLLRRYPTVDALAAAPLDEVKAITDPLGYKVRGQWLHGAAVQVADRLGGRFPRSLDGLRALPGVGPYTAGAVMNFAYRKDAPALDTNVARVLRRHFGIRVEQRARPVSLWHLAKVIIPAGKGYLINQALMDLGAMVCGARTPRCTVCPVQRSCAFRRSRQRRSSEISEHPLRARASPRRRPGRSRPGAVPRRS